ncbi:MAG: DUF1338 domain-containing protein [Leptolyngbyaceae cyanobacterium MO_188.B28]|nr:DUF1338 domain-containing protein [Leptolyngbyaceae cyanobacterium MO_188.B28]
MNRAKVVKHLWRRLWRNYSRRVEYARIYQQMIEAAGGEAANDHIAFRSLRLTVDTADGAINLGIPYLANIIEALGYTAAGEYEFPDQALYARHYRHPQQDRFDLPKIFISELIVEALPSAIAQLIIQTVSSGQFYNWKSLQHQIEAVINEPDNSSESLVDQLQPIFTRPWPPPKQSVVETVNSISQYGAWVLLHGYAVNHFTGYINRQQTPLYPDIESTAKGLAERGIPMKADIEGDRGSGLRQTATRAVTEKVTVEEDHSGRLIQIPWTYAYYEIAERNLIEADSGQPQLFEGFLGPQARNLFEMTQKR